MDAFLVNGIANSTFVCRFHMQAVDVLTMSTRRIFEATGSMSWSKWP
jgi:hypothetical protein